MKSFNRYSVITSIVVVLALAGCKDDVYEPGKIRPIPPAENPFGEDFKAPDGFDWSMITSVKLNVEVKDEFNGAYEYLIEVFTSNPMADATLIPIAAGYAKSGKNYSTEINVPRTTTKIYIRQTNPEQRQSIFEYTMPEENGSTITCKLHHTVPTTKATTRASGNGNSGWDKITPLNYTEENYDIPSESAAISGNQLPAGSAYVIKPGETFKGVLHSYGIDNATVFVQGIWDVSEGCSPQGIDIIVLDGGKIIASSNSFMVSDKSSLTIQKGGIVDCYYFSTATQVVIKNFGSFNAKGGIRSQYNDGNGFNSETILYNAPEATFNVDGNFHLTSSQIHNRSTMTINGNILTNNDLTCIIANYESATLNADELSGGATIVNSGKIEINKCENSSTDYLYNNCTFIVKNSFKFRNVVLDHGSITAGQSEDGTWLPTPYVESNTDSKFILRNGSIIKAETFNILSGDVRFTGENDNSNTDISMIQATVIKYNWHTYISGNIVIEGEADFSNSSNNTECLHADGIEQTSIGASSHTIETCSGIIHEAPKSENPETPEYPEEVGSSDSYTYAFEDQWPVYGDYDMNDVVLTIDEIKLNIKKENGDEYVKEAKIEGRVKAVGASRTLGIGIQFLGLDNNVKTSQLKQNGDDVSFEEGNYYPTLIVCEDVHRYMDPGQADNTFINTETGGKTKEDKNFNFSFKFAGQDVAPEAFNIDKLDIFIYTQRDAYVPYRREVHLAGYAPTAKADQSYSSASNDDGSNRFISRDNLAWAIRIPGKDWRWPKELSMITAAYGDFYDWVTSGGTSNPDWSNNNINSDNLY